jgi:spore germination protein YaaH
MNLRGMICCVGVVASSLLAPVSASAESPVKVAVTAFFQAWQSTDLITRSAAGITNVGVDGIPISSGGGDVATPDADAQNALEVAHDYGLTAEILVNNWSDELGDFDTAAAHKLLSSPSKINTVATKIAGYVESQGWDGVSMDLEALRSSDAAGLVSLLHLIRIKLIDDKAMSICISNRGSVAGYRDAGYDLAGIAANVDRVMDMAYDQHGPWEKKPGPVGAFAWQKAGLAALAQKVPVDKIDLGQAAYGYIWRPKGARAVSDAKARAIVTKDHATAHFDTRTGEWLAQLSNRSTMWWADARSLAMRMAYARTAGIHGLAVWDLGQSDPITQ